jgi:hypothetical protein
MENNRSKLGKVLSIVTSLATLGAVNTSAQDVWNRTWDTISLSDNKYEITLTPDSKTNLTYLLRQGNGKFVDPVIGTRNVIKYLQNDRLKPFNERKFTKEQREIEIARYAKILQELTKREIGSYYLASLDLLNEAVKDKVLESVKDGLYSNGKWNIYDGIFMLISSPDCNNWSYPIYLDLRLKENKLEQAVQNPALSPAQNPSKKEEAPKATEAECKPEIYGLDLTKAIPQAGYYPPNFCPKPDAGRKQDSSCYGGIPGVPLLLPEAPKEIPNIPKKGEKDKEEKDYRGIRFLTQATSNLKANAYSLGFGAIFKPFKDADVGLGAILDVGLGLDRLVEEYTAPLSAERIAYGTVTNANNLSLGLSAEAQVGPFFAGAKISYEQWIDRVSEEIRDKYGTTLKSNINSKLDRQVSVDPYGGVEVPLGDKFNLRVIAGRNKRNGGWAGLGGTIKVK